MPLALPCALVNDDGTRTFLALELDAPAHAAVAAALQRALAAVDAAFVRHGLPAYYVPARPHVSLAWVLGSRAPAVAAAAAAAAAVAPPAWVAAVERVELITGNKTHVVWGDSAK